MGNNGKSLKHSYGGLRVSQKHDSIPLEAAFINHENLYLGAAKCCKKPYSKFMVGHLGSLHKK